MIRRRWEVVALAKESGRRLETPYRMLFWTERNARAEAALMNRLGYLVVYVVERREPTRQNLVR